MFVDQDVQSSAVSHHVKACLDGHEMLSVLMCLLHRTTENYEAP